MLSTRAFTPHARTNWDHVPYHNQNQNLIMIFTFGEELERHHNWFTMTVEHKTSVARQSIPIYYTSFRYYTLIS